MKTTRLIMLAFLSVSLVFLSGCKDDPEEEVSPYIGDYIITSAALSESVTLNTNIGEFTVPAGTDITQMIIQALLGAIECVPESSLIELREDFSMFLSCSTSGTELDAGTWEEQSVTVILLNLNSTAIPSSPSGMVLTISNVTLVSNVLSGTTTVPLPREMLAAVIELLSSGQVHLDLENTPVVVPVTFTIVLAKQ